MGDSQGGITDLSCLLTEYGTKQSFFGGKLGLARGGDLTYQYITGTNLGADADDASIVKIAQTVFADVGDAAGNFFRTTDPADSFPEVCRSFLPPGKGGAYVSGRWHDLPGNESDPGGQNR